MNGADNDGGASAKPALAASTTTTTATATASPAPQPQPALSNHPSDRRSIGNNNNNKMATGDGEMAETNPCSSSNRRPQIQITPIPQVTTPTTPNPASPKNFLYLTLTVRKDENGYGMKVRNQDQKRKSLEENILMKINKEDTGKIG